MCFFVGSEGVLSNEDDLMKYIQENRKGKPLEKARLVIFGRTTLFTVRCLISFIIARKDL